MKQLCWVLLAAACSSSSPSKKMPDAAAGDDAPPYPAYSGAVPQIGHQVATPKVIASPTIVAVYYTGDTQQTAVDGFMTAFVGSPQWSALSEYGVGAATVGTSIVLTDTPPGTATETDVDTFIKGKLDGTHAEWGAVDATTLASKIFVLYYPMATTLTLGGQNLCAGIAAYHRDTVLTSGARVNYAVVPRCASTTTDVLTAATSYAVPAIATDVIVDGVASGWYGYDTAHTAWGMYGAEVSDPLCGTAMVGGHAAAKIWSNTAAAAYHDPCVPAQTPYFNSAPLVTDAISMQGTGLVVPVGGTKKIDVQLFSDAPTSGDWSLSVTTMGGTVSLALDANTGHNGSVLHLTGTSTGGTSQGLAYLKSTLGAVSTYWYFPVASR